jgi:hypothetical protein
MSKISLKGFKTAFKDASRKSANMAKGYKTQLDELQKIVDAINAEGTFKAALTSWAGNMPGLDITHKDDSQPVSFLIGFGYQVFGGSATLSLSVTEARTPVGKPEGYDLDLDYDRDHFLEMLGKAVAQGRNGAKLAEDALKYATAKNAPKP